MAQSANLAELDRQGFTVLRNVLSQDEIERGRRLLDDLYENFDPRVDPNFIDGKNTAPGKNLTLPRDRGYSYASNLLSKDQLFRDMIDREPVVTIARSVLGSNCLLAEGNISSLEPLRGSGHQDLHRDTEGPTPPEGPILMGSLWVFDDMDKDNGATRVISGTHTEEDASEEDPRLTYVAVPAGSVVVTNAHVLHAASLNRDGRRRRVVHSFYARNGNAELAGTLVDQSKYLPEAALALLTREQKQMLGL